LYDLEAQVARNAPNARAAIEQRVKEQAEKPHRDTDRVIAIGNAELIRGTKAAGVCGRNHQRTDPITHFRHENHGKEEVLWWKPCRQATQNGRLGHAQTWTWQTHIDLSSLSGRKQADLEKENMLKETTAHLNAQKHKAMGDLVTCRGERVYNLCGAEDMLPSGIYEYIKCDVPPTRTQILLNDQKYLPVCVRAMHLGGYLRPNDYNNSEGVWKIFQKGAWSTDYIEEAAKADSAIQEARSLERTRPQTARAVLQTSGTGKERIDPRNEVEPMHIRRRKKNTEVKKLRPMEKSESPLENPAIDAIKSGGLNENQGQSPTERRMASRPDWNSDTSLADSPPPPACMQRPSSGGSSLSTMRALEALERRAQSIRSPGAVKKANSTGSVGDGTRNSSGNGGSMRRASSVGAISDTRGNASNNGGSLRRQSSTGSLGDARRSLSSTTSPVKPNRRSPSETSFRSSRPPSSLEDLTSTRWR